MRYMKAGLIALLVTACGKDATAPVLPVEGMTFGYAGALSGTFSANGAYDSTGTKAWAIAGRLVGAPYLVLAAVLPRNETSHDAIGIIVPRNTVGTATISTICPPEGCADFLAVFGRHNTVNNEFLQGCHIVSGTVTIATITDTRVTGSFTGSGTCFSNATGDTAFTVSNGAFDLPIAPAPTT
jgi:hypothetical protein